MLLYGLNSMFVGLIRIHKGILKVNAQVLEFYYLFSEPCMIGLLENLCNPTLLKLFIRRSLQTILSIVLRLGDGESAGEGVLVISRLLLMSVRHLAFFLDEAGCWDLIKQVVSSDILWIL